MSAAYKTITANAQATSVPTELNSVSVMSLDGGCVVYLRDGGSSGALAVYISTSVANESSSISFPIPVLFNNGIYVTIASGTNVKVSLSYI